MEGKREEEKILMELTFLYNKNLLQFFDTNQNFLFYLVWEIISREH